MRRRDVRVLVLRHGRTLVDVQVTEDGHYVVIEGRRWRASDPSLPEHVAAALRKELMSARRGVGAALRASDSAAERAARDRVQAAKVALGERGEPWWSQTDEERRARWEPLMAKITDERLQSTIRELLDQRGPGKTICPSEVARAVGGDSWRPLMEPARQAARRLVEAGEVEITQGGRGVDPSTAKGPIRIRRRR